MSSVNVNVMNASMNVPNSVVSMLTNLARDVVLSCASRHGFDAEEEMRHLGLDTGVGITFTEKKGKKEVYSQPKETKAFRGNFPLPYNGVVMEDCCYGVKDNHGLMTQCRNSPKSDSKLCKTCSNQAANNANGTLIYGTMDMRKACGIFEFVASNGKSPVPYSKVMKKLNLSMEEVEAEAAKRNMVIHPDHFIEHEVKRGRGKKVVKASDKESDKESASESASEEKPKAVKGKGRPKKAEKVVELAEPTDDLFATLMASTPKVAEKVAEKVTEEVTEEVAAEEPKVAKKRVTKKKVVAEPVVEKVAEPVVEVAKVVEVPKVVEPVVAKAVEVPKVVEPVVVKVAAKVVEKVAEEEEEEEEEEEDDEEVDDVVRIEYKGVKYLRSENTGVIYNMDEDVVGKWNDKTKEIDFHDVEEEEEEYDEE